MTFSKFDTQLHSDEQATRYEEEQELLRASAEEAAREEARESLLGHIRIPLYTDCVGYEPEEPNPYHGTYSEE